MPGRSPLQICMHVLEDASDSHVSEAKHLLSLGLRPLIVGTLRVLVGAKLSLSGAVLVPSGACQQVVISGQSNEEATAAQRLLLTLSSAGVTEHLTMHVTTQEGTILNPNYACDRACCHSMPCHHLCHTAFLSGCRTVASRNKSWSLLRT